MTVLDKRMIKYLADLSRIAVSAEEEESLLRDLAKILRYVEQLDEVDTSNVPPCTYVTQTLSETPLRKDEVTATLTREEFLDITPAKIAGMVQVPPVLKQQ